jgi:5-methylcytosine-specific restriction endonuclease McrA
MKPGRPLRRLTPLRSSSTLSRSRLRPRSAKRAHEARLWSHVRTVVFARDGGCCVRCGVTLHAAAWECHHRQLRSQGGPDAPFNLVALDENCHRWAHSRRLESEPLGFIVPATADPAAIPVVYFDGTTRLLAEKEAA